MPIENQASKMAVQVAQRLGNVLCPDIDTGEVMLPSVFIVAFFDDKK